jgi:hypothetical protein
MTAAVHQDKLAAAAHSRRRDNTIGHHSTITNQLLSLSLLLELP